MTILPTPGKWSGREATSDHEADEARNDSGNDEPVYARERSGNAVDLLVHMPPAFVMARAVYVPLCAPCLKRGKTGLPALRRML